MNVQEQLERLYNLGKENVDRTIITILCNVDGITKDYNDYDEYSVRSEYMTFDQYDLILRSFRDEGFETNGYSDEDDFLRDVLTDNFYTDVKKRNIIINSAQKGTAVGRKSLVPAFCDLHDLWHSNSDAYAVSLCRNKYHLHCLLEAANIPKPPSWYYTQRSGWYNGVRPPFGEKVIAKLNYETSSIGLDDNNIFNYQNESDSLLLELCKKYSQDVIVQAFIEGYEVEVPVIMNEKSFSPGAMCVQYNGNSMIGNQILDYDIRRNHEYTYIPFARINQNMTHHLEQYALKTSWLLPISGLGRIDFRIDLNGDIFVIDIATNPGISKYTAIYNAFLTCGFSYSQMMTTFAGMVIDKYLALGKHL